MDVLHGTYQGDYVPPRWAEMVSPHLESFNHFLTAGMAEVVDSMEPLEFTLNKGEAQHAVRLWFENIRFDKPKVDNEKLWPTTCRQAGMSYKGALTCDVMLSADGEAPLRTRCALGQLPVMVRSVGCWTAGLNREQLLEHREEANEMGGYFICNGIERIIRMVIMQKRHHIVGVKRASNAARYPGFTPYATFLRCVLPDERGAVVKCYYEEGGTVKTGITIGNREAFIPTAVLLRALDECTESQLYHHIMAAAPRPDPSDPGDFHVFLARRVEELLREGHRQGVRSRAQALAYLGRQLRDKLGPGAAGLPDVQVGQQVLSRFLLIHLPQFGDKLLTLIAMVQKVYALAAGDCCADNVDALAAHEVLTPGALMAKALRERLLDWQAEAKRVMERDARVDASRVDLQSNKYVAKLCGMLPDVGGKLEYMINTGNLKVDSSTRRPDVPQASGFTVVAEKLNWFRYLSHFRSVHRGAYFNDSRTASVRKLLPEGWGFLCPVHTPDGAPCGLLNHLAAQARVVTGAPPDAQEAGRQLRRLLGRFGVRPAGTMLAPPQRPHALVVMLDGGVVGYVDADRAEALVAGLKDVKAARLAVAEGRQPHIQLTAADECVPYHMEVAYCPYVKGGPFPGVFLFTSGSRLVRPVRQLHSGATELVGPLEQVNMHIRCPDGGAGGSAGLPFTHEELSSVAMLSIVAGLTPYSDFNQSPRNMYQCQMGKQTMGNPLHSFPYRTDGKLYRLLMPQSPICRTGRYNEYHMDEYPNGTNAVVAVLAYTGYDMEDGMILNQASVDRGFGHAVMYKSEMIDLREGAGRGGGGGGEDAKRFAPERAPAGQWLPRDKAKLGLWEQALPCNVATQPGSAGVQALGLSPLGPYRNSDKVDVDGLPHVGAIVHPGEAYYNVHSPEGNGSDRPARLKGKEVAAVDGVTLVGRGDSRVADRANVKLRINRNPVIGDKFSSRHGQKGVLSKLWPDADMPFAPATGMRPDLIINPNAFPSRMTIGMLIESLAGKAGALGGRWVDATPFQTAGGAAESPAATFGRALEEAGFARTGGETMVSGVTGEEFPADIYMGCVYYQRLRHMVSDKFQVRSTGSIDPVLHQPVKGRKAGGGIRFGEMERDSLLGHGASYLLHDRLHGSSDYKPLHMCTACGSLLSAKWSRFRSPGGAGGAPLHAASVEQGRWHCISCDSSRHVEQVSIPAVFKYLVVELAAMNIQVVVHVDDPRIRRAAAAEVGA